VNTTERALTRRAAWISGRAARVSVLMSAVALIGVGAAVAASATTIRSANNATLGRILESPSRHTLYVFVQGTSSKGSAHSQAGWPALTASGRVVAAQGSHINAKKLSTRKLSNGKHQVTYYGQPLYTFTGDKKAGQTKGEAKSTSTGTWVVISTTGRPVPPPGY
jgi:predicted lipoprotein with Yx(FWY)xxD motif